MIIRLKRVGYAEQLFENAGTLTLEFGKNIGRINYSDSLGPHDFEFELSQLETWEDLAWYNDPLEKFKQPIPARTESQVSSSAAADIKNSPTINQSNPTNQPKS